jgi:hypothetical protein
MTGTTRNAGEGSQRRTRTVPPWQTLGARPSMARSRHGRVSTVPRGFAGWLVRHRGEGACAHNPRLGPGRRFRAAARAAQEAIRGVSRLREVVRGEPAEGGEATGGGVRSLALGHWSATLAMARRYAHLGSADLRAAMDSLPAPAKPAAVDTARQVVPITSRTKAG